MLMCDSVLRMLTVMAVVVSVLVLVSDGHPQCTDSRPPFTPTPHLEFCTLYSDFSCCDLWKDKEIEERYHFILSYLTLQEYESCPSLIRQILCLQCSPYAAHLYDTELNSDVRPLPGLCWDFCYEFHWNCNRFIYPLMSDSYDIAAVVYSEIAFCTTVRPHDVQYCYPDILAVDQFTANIRKSDESGCLCLEEFASGLRNPVFAVSPPDGSERLLVGEQIGTIWVYQKDGYCLPTPFMNVSTEIFTPDTPGDERGLLAMVFHPLFESNGIYYLYYTTGLDGNISLVTQYSVSHWSSDRGDPDTAQTILTLNQPEPNHNGAQLLFDDDGMLLVFLGDGGGQHDPHGNGQDRSTLLGSVLRINVTDPYSSAPYTIPTDNPFLSDPHTADEIWAYGLRNPWRCSIDRGDPSTGADAGRVFCADVGQYSEEEIDIIERGQNYGWRAFEGFQCHDATMCDELVSEVTWPVYTYNHTKGQSVTGGYVYRGCQFPNLNGLYFFADFMTGQMFSMTESESTGGDWVVSDVCMGDLFTCTGTLQNIYEPHIMSFAEDQHGELYILTTSDYEPHSPEGKIYKMIDPTRRNDPNVCIQREL